MLATKDLSQTKADNFIEQYFHYQSPVSMPPASEPFATAMCSPKELRFRYGTALQSWNVSIGHQVINNQWNMCPSIVINHPCIGRKMKRKDCSTFSHSVTVGDRFGEMNLSLKIALMADKVDSGHQLSYQINVTLAGIKHLNNKQVSSFSHIHTVDEV